MNPFSKLQNGIPLHEAAAFFTKLKTANYAPPDETGELEGQFAAPVEQVLEHMALMVQNELKTQYAYMVYGNSLRDLSHFAIAEEFQQHADMETDHAEWLLRRMSVLGGAPQVPPIPAPPPATDPAEIIQIMIRMEQEGIQNWRLLRDMLGEENPSKFKVEEFLTREQEHLDELWQLSPRVEQQPAQPTAPPEPGELAAQPSAQPKQANAAAGMHQPPPPQPPLQGAAAGAVAPVAPPAAPLQGAAAGQHAAPGKMASRMKRAFEEMSDAPDSPPPAPGGEQEAALQKYLQEEMAGQEAEMGAEQAFYKQKFEQASQELQAAQEQSQAAQQQVQMLQEQVNNGATMQQQALQQAQMIQDQAMQQATSANTAAAAAMQKTLAAQQEQLTQQQLSVQMRDAVQAIKTQVMNMVQTELPPATTMEAGMSGAADQAHADAQAQQEAEAAMMGQDPNQAGQPQATGDAGTPPTSAAPGGQGPEASPQNAEPAKPPTDGAMPKSESGQSESGPEKEPEKSASDRFIGALLGGAAGGAGTAIESQMSNDPLRQKVKKLEAMERSGEGGFGNAMNLAQSKMRLAMGEVAERHPVGATIAGTALGALAGAKAAPHVREIAKTIRG